MYGRVTRFVVTLAVAALAVTASLSVRRPERAQAASYIAPPLRQQFDLTSDWRFVRTDVPDAQESDAPDSAWSKVTVPHTWNVHDGQDGGAIYYRGVGWYRRHF